MLGPVVVVCLQACQLVFRKLNMQLQVFPRDYRANFVFNMRFFLSLIKNTINLYYVPVLSIFQIIYRYLCSFAKKLNS
jgi:hypothetical protein